jgi:hypothetical protein
MMRPLLLVASLAFAATAAAQTPIPGSKIAIGSGVTLKTFTPTDSLFVNSTQTSFPITLTNTISGSATEYRVSRFADFRDAAWRPYSARPALTVPRAWFETVSNGLYQVTLHFQVRNKNPRAGMPTSLVDNAVQPDFFFSEVLAGHIRLVYAG